MARKPMQTQSVSTPGEIDQVALMTQLKALDQTLSAINSRQVGIEAQIKAIASRQEDAEARQDDRLTERFAPLKLRIVSTTEQAMKASSTMTAEIQAAGEEARREMARTSRMAKMLLESVGNTANARLQAMQEQTTNLASTAEAAMAQRLEATGAEATALLTQKIEAIEQEAITLMEGMRNAAVSAVGGVGVAATKLEQAATLAKGLIESTASKAATAIEQTANNAEKSFVKATSEAMQAFNLSKKYVLSFEKSVADLKLIGPWLSNQVERRTWQIAGATGISAVATVGAALLIYRGALWVMGVAL